MIKKLVTAAMAALFATALAAPAVMACPGHEGSVAKKEKAKDTAKVAQKDKVKKDVKVKKDAKKVVVKN